MGHIGKEAGFGPVGAFCPLLGPDNISNVHHNQHNTCYFLVLINSRSYINIKILLHTMNLHAVHVLDIFSLVPGFLAHFLNVATPDIVHKALEQVINIHAIINLLKSIAGTLKKRLRGHNCIQVHIQHYRYIR